MKKGEMSMAVIIGAAIALLILVIISVLLFGSFDSLNQGTSCESASIGGYCSDPDIGCDSSEIRSNNNCDDPDYICCIPRE